MKEALYNLFDKDGVLYAVEKWEWSEEYSGYKVFTLSKQGINDREWHECSQPNLSMKREPVKDEESFEFDTTALSKEDQVKFMMLLNSGVKIKVARQE